MQAFIFWLVVDCYRLIVFSQKAQKYTEFYATCKARHF